MAWEKVKLQRIKEDLQGIYLFSRLNEAEIIVQDQEWDSSI